MTIDNPTKKPHIRSTKPRTPMAKVNLDALIPKEDFHFVQSSRSKGPSKLISLSMGHLLPSSSGNPLSIYHLLKKPDFQRETNAWDKKRIANLIESFISGSFIPSIILWQNPITNTLFVFDGAHRLSALIAYFNDDYGDRDISLEYYGYSKIPDAELELAQETREWINKRIGSFNDVMSESPKYEQHRNNLKLNSSFDVQTIYSDALKAEESFFKINEQGVILRKEEKELCKGRKYPTRIATRSILKGSSGRQYWSKFEATNQSSAESIAVELNKLLFTPPYNSEPKSILLHHPLGGNITTALPIVFDLVKIVKGEKEESEEVNGDQTVFFLQATRKLIWTICADVPGSLGLVPSIYFYNSLGKFIPSAFLGFAQLLAERRSNSDYLSAFTKVRAKMEDFLIQYKVLITQIVRKYGSKEKSYRHLKGFFMNVIEYLNNGIDGDELINKLLEKYDFLNVQESEIPKPKSRKFSKETKTSVTISEDFKRLSKCGICGGSLHPLSISFDHKTDKKHGGGGERENVGPTHHFCNNSKDLLRRKGIYIDDTPRVNP